MAFRAGGIGNGRPLRWPMQVLAILLCLAFAGPRAQALALEEIRYWSLGDITRVVIQFDGEFRYKWARLENPPRVFFDLPEAKLSVDGQKERGRMRSIEVNDRVLKQIRFAENTPGSSRVVLDLAGDYEFSASQLANPARLIVEIRGPGRGDGQVEVSRTGGVGGAARTPGATVAAPAREAEKPGARPTEASPSRNDAVLRAATPPPPLVPQPETLSSAKPTSPAKTVASAPLPVPVPAAKERPAPISPAPIGKPAARTATGQQSLTRALGLKIGRVVIDPGHGGKDHGTTGGNGLLEKDLVLDIAMRVKALVEDNLGSEVLLTREDDEFLTLEERADFANRHRADLFVSLHANSSPFRLASGPETFYLDFTTSRESMDIAARENASSTKSVADLQDIVKKIASKDKRDESRDFAAKMQGALFKAQLRTGKAKKNRGVKSAPFIVLVGAEMPSILVEIGFLSNKREEDALKTSEHRQTVAQAIFNGLNSYLASLSHFEPRERAARE
ncbi:MAG: N-acetylmuramoyl-L-alanine amidase [Bryobacterales bacterium]|nr:N-acetylmuramoyl-L-alanine amidase [Bryobacterales bacterium]